jgi:hypothetical protein
MPRWTVVSKAIALVAVALVGCSSSSSNSQSALHCCIIQKLIAACPTVYPAAATTIANSGNDEACQSWLDEPSEGPSGWNCVNGYGPVYTVDQATAACSQ